MPFIDLSKHISPVFNENSPHHVWTNFEIPTTVPLPRSVHSAWCRIQAVACRPVGKRGVQSGIFEDEQELLLPRPSPGRMPLSCYRVDGSRTDSRSPAGGQYNSLGKSLIPTGRTTYSLLKFSIEPTGLLYTTVVLRLTVVVK